MSQPLTNMTHYFIKLMVFAVIGGLVANAAEPRAADVVTHPTLQTELLAWYSFDGDFTDARGTRNAKPANATPGFGADRLGKPNRAFQATGGEALAASGIMIGNGSFSIQFWALNPTNWFLGQGERSDNKGMHIGVDGSGMRFDYWGNSLSAPLGASAGWSHWVIAHDGASNSKSIWRDGKCVARATAAAYAGTGPVIIGRHFSGGGYFAGSLDDLAFWNRALTPAEIGDLYAEGRGLIFRLK